MSGRRGTKAKNVSIEVVPTSGTPETKQVSVAPSVTVRDALVQAGISGEDKNIIVDGKAATLDTELTGKDPKIRIEERPAGS